LPAETLRKYPPLTFLNRHCTKDYKIPDTNLVVEKGVQVVVPVLGLHKDPEYFPDPEKFDPERFSEETKSRRPNYVYLPFGEGPRICIGNSLFTGLIL
jgi:cytochrome P450 family 6